MDDFFEIFRTGIHTDSMGDQKDWTEEELNRIAARYNEQKEHEAPLVIGHPETNHPAYGWVESLKVEAGKLLAKAAQIVPEFAEAIKAGLYKKRSISLYPDLLLRHVGFLGAVPPAVKGLKDIAFSAMEYVEYTGDFPATRDDQSPDFDYAQSPVEKELVVENNTLKITLAEKDQQLTDANSRLNEKEYLLTEANTKLAGLQKEFSEFKSAREKTDFKVFLESKVAVRAITPAQAELVMSFYDDLKNANMLNITFSDLAGADGGEKNPTAFLKNFVEKMPKILPGNSDIPGTEPDGIIPDAEEMGLKAREYVDEQHKKGITISCTEAVKIVKASRGAGSVR